MKNVIMNKAYSSIICTFLFLLLTSISFGQETKTKTIGKSFDSKNIVQIEHSYGPLIIRKATTNEIKLTANLKVTAKNSKDIQVAFDHFDMDISDVGNRLSISTDLKIATWNVFGNRRSKITFKDKVTVKGITSLDLELILYIPDQVSELELTNKYQDIELPELNNTKLTVNLHNGDLRAYGQLSDFDLKVKYGKVSLKELGKGNFYLYDSKLEMGNADELIIRSKYSEYEIGDVKKLEIDSYDDTYSLGDVGGNLELEDKYSEIKINSIVTSDMKLYDSELKNEKAQSLKIDSKYTEYKFGTIGSLSFRNSYDDNITIQQINDLTATSKYTEFRIEEFNGKLDFETYDDELIIRNVGSNLGNSKIKGKYTDIEMPIPTSVSYQIEAKLRYGEIKYPEDAFDMEYYKEKGEDIEMRGKASGTGGQSPLLQLDLYDCNIDLN